MSWQEYVDVTLANEQISQSAIFSHVGDLWAKSAALNITPAEQKTIAAAFNDPAKTQANGVTVAGTKYMTISVEPEILVAKKGASGVIICKTKQAIVLGIHDDKLLTSNARNAVEKLGDYLKTSGY